MPVRVEAAVSAFHAVHAQRYGYAMEDEGVEVVTLRVRASGPGAQPALPRSPLESEDADGARSGNQTDLV